MTHETVQNKVNQDRTGDVEGALTMGGLSLLFALVATAVFTSSITARNPGDCIDALDRSAAIRVIENECTEDIQAENNMNLQPQVDADGTLTGYTLVNQEAVEDNAREDTAIKIGGYGVAALVGVGVGAWAYRKP